MNMYYYVGLNRALEQFIRINANEDEEEVDTNAISQIQTTELNQKLLDLLQNKEIERIGFENIDEVINKVSDKIIETFVEGTMEATHYGN